MFYKEDKRSGVVSRVEKNLEKILSARVSGVPYNVSLVKKEVKKTMVTLAPYRAKILQELKKVARERKFGKNETKEAAERLGLKLGSIRACLTLLVEKGLLERLRGGDYEILEAEYKIGSEPRVPKAPKILPPSPIKEVKIRSKEEIADEIAQLKIEIEQHQTRLQSLELLLENYDTLIPLLKSPK